MSNTLYKSTSEQKNTLTLTKSELACLNATIEILLEEETGRTESVTIMVDSPAAFPGALVKGFKAVNKIVQKYGGWAALATEVADAIWGLTAETARVSREQANAVDQLRASVNRGISLEDLLELRDRIEDQAGKRRER